jgi:hypothetical protein
MILKRAVRILGPAFLLVSHCSATSTLSTGEDVDGFVDAKIQQSPVSTIMVENEEFWSIILIDFVL